MNIEKEKIIQLTEQYGGAWGINHTRRLLHLVEAIAPNQAYDTEAVWLAAHLHDWGAYAPWAQKDIDHVVRSLQVVETFLKELSCPEPLMNMVLVCIEHHHKGGYPECIESVLLSDADILDFLGVVGVLRDFSKNPKDLRLAYETVRKRRAKLPGMLRLEKSKELASLRLQHMDELLARFEQDSWGCF